MAEGQKAAEQTKAAMKQAGVSRYPVSHLHNLPSKPSHHQETSESIRQNINSYIDTLLSDSSGNKEHSSTGINPDAKKTGDELAKGAGAVAGKVENLTKSEKSTTSAPSATTPGQPRPGELRPSETNSGESRPGDTTVREEVVTQDGHAETRPPGTEHR